MSAHQSTVRRRLSRRPTSDARSAAGALTWAHMPKEVNMATPPFARAFVEPARQAQLRDLLTAMDAAHDISYHSLLQATVTVLQDVRGADEYSTMDPKRIHDIDDGDYQGTLLFVIAAAGYRPSNYWATKVSYGSCSSCDTLDSIRDDSPSGSARVDAYMTLCLHMVQQIKEV